MGIRRMLAALTIMAMLVSLLPISAFADDNPAEVKGNDVIEDLADGEETPPQKSEPETSGEEVEVGDGEQNIPQDDNSADDDAIVGDNQESGDEEGEDEQQSEEAESANPAGNAAVDGGQKAGLQAGTKAPIQLNKAAAPPLRGADDITVKYYTDETCSVKGSAWKDSELISRKAAYAVISPPDTNVVKPKSGYTLDYINVKYTGVDDKIYPGQRGNYPKISDPWWSRIDEITTTFVWKRLPEHDITYSYDLTNGYPSDFDPLTPPAPTTAAEESIVDLPQGPTTAVTTDGSREGKWEFTWTAATSGGKPISISNNKFEMPAEDVTVIGSWSFTPNKHKVTFVLNGGTMNSPSELTVNDGDTVSRPSDTPVKGDKNYFDNWYADDQFKKEFDFDNTKIKAETKIYAGYIKYYTIKFDLNGGTLTHPMPLVQDVEKGRKIKIPVWNDSDPKGERIQDLLIPPVGSEYKGVEIDGKFYAPGTYYEVTKDATVKVLYTSKSPNTYTISYNLNGGMLNGKTGIVTINAEEGSVIILPAPTRDGYTFDYWEGSRYNAGDRYVVRGNHTLTAQWKKNSTTPTDDNNKGPTNKDSQVNSPKTGDFHDAVIWNSLRCMLTAMLFALLILASKGRNRDLN